MHGGGGGGEGVRIPFTKFEGNYNTIKCLTYTEQAPSLSRLLFVVVTGAL